MSQSNSPSSPQPPKRIAQTIHLKPSSVPEYERIHASVWPSVLAQIKDSNITDYSIFFDEHSSTLFATFKYVVQDWEGDMRRMRENAEVRRWWDITDAMQESRVPGATGSKDGEWWTGLAEVFRME